MWAAVGLVLAGLVGGCSSQQERYCAAVSEHQAELSTGSATGPAALLANRSALAEIAAQAPGDIKDEWQTLLNAVDALQAAFDELGVDPATYDPARATPKQRDRIEPAAAALVEPAVSDAASGIDQQVRDVCQVQLGFTG